MVLAASHLPAVAALEQLGEGVLEQWQAAGLGRGICNELGEQSGRHLRSDPSGGPDHGALQLSRGHGVDIEHAG